MLRFESLEGFPAAWQALEDSRLNCFKILWSIAR
jgi:hypothetical protein